METAHPFALSCRRHHRLQKVPPPWTDPRPLEPSLPLSLAQPWAALLYFLSPRGSSSRDLRTGSSRTGPFASAVGHRVRGPQVTAHVGTPCLCKANVPSCAACSLPVQLLGRVRVSAAVNDAALSTRCLFTLGCLCLRLRVCLWPAYGRWKFLGQGSTLPQSTE